jgi:hypothetical protein
MRRFSLCRRLRNPPPCPLKPRSLGAIIAYTGMHGAVSAKSGLTDKQRKMKGKTI